LSEILTVKAAICPFCRELGAKVLIDDNPIYAVECANAGINVLLYDWHGAKQLMGMSLSTALLHAALLLLALLY